MSIRVRRSWSERLLHLAQAKYECLGCSSVFFAGRDARKHVVHHGMASRGRPAQASTGRAFPE